MRGRRLPFVSLMALIAVATVPVAAQRPAAPPVAASARETALPEIKYTRFSLPNGLRVVFHEDHSTPVVAVNVWYHVGSKNESALRVRLCPSFRAHDVPGVSGIPLRVRRDDGRSSARLTQRLDQHRSDQNYYEVVPSNFLDTALFMEAGRMGRLLETVTQERLDNQRDVVKNEKRRWIESHLTARRSTASRRRCIRPSTRTAAGDWVHGGPHGRLPRRRLGVLSHLLRSQQRDSRAGRRLRPSEGPNARREALQRHRSRGSA